MTSVCSNSIPGFSSLSPEQLLLGGVALLVLGRGGVLQGAQSLDFARIKKRLLRGRKGCGIAVGKEWVPDQARLRHTHIVGATGTGKTVLIENLLFQDLKRGYGAIIIDPKGEREFYDQVRSFCQEIGRTGDLHYLSATYPEESAVWNPCSLGSTSELQTKFFNSAIYSEPHYAKACEFGLLKAFSEIKSSGNQSPRIPDLIQKLEKLARDDREKTLAGLFYDLNNLAHGEWREILGCGASAGRKEISILDVVSNNQILFVDLPTEGKKVQSSRIGRLLTQEIILISGMRKRLPELKGDRPFSVYIDEFDAFATESFATFLNKGRSSDFMIHLAHQTLSDLKVISESFAGQILGNSNVRFIFRQDDPEDAETWSRFIGTRKTTKQTYRTSQGTRTGESSNREGQEFIVNPDRIKSLRVGECVFSMKTERELSILRVPLMKRRRAIKAPAIQAAPLNAMEAEISPVTTSQENKWSKLLEGEKK